MQVTLDRVARATRGRRRIASSLALTICVSAACSTAFAAPAAAAPDPALGASAKAVQRGFELSNGDSARVDVTTGNLLVKENDTVVSGLTLDLELDRAYNSRSSERTDLSPGWRFENGYDVRLINPGAPSTTYLRGDGRQITFQQQSGGNYLASSDQGLELLAAPGGWRLVDQSSPIEQVFDGSGLLQAERRGAAATSTAYTSAAGLTRTSWLGDEFGTRSHFSHDGFGRTLEVDDPDSGHRLYAYDGGASGALRSVSLPGGSRFEYDYTTVGCRDTVVSCLEEVRRPDGSVLNIEYGTDGQVTELTRTADGQSKTLQFEYLPSVTRVTENGSTVEYVYRGERVVAPDDTNPRATLIDDDGDGTDDEENAVINVAAGEGAQIGVAGADTGSGVKRLDVLDASGGVLTTASASCTPLSTPNGGVPEICPETFESGITLSSGQLLAAGSEIRVRAVDAAGNSALSRRISIAVDDSPPAAPADLRVLSYSSALSRLSVAWEGSDDDASGNEGSGLERSEVRYRRLPGSTFSSWADAPMEVLEIENIAEGAEVEVQVRSVDQVGNTSPVTSEVLSAESGNSAATAGVATYRLKLQMDPGYGAPHPSAGTPVELEGEGVTLQKETGTDGRVSFSNLEPGAYKVDPLADPEGSPSFDVQVSAAPTSTDLVTISSGYAPGPEEKRFCATNGTYCIGFISDVGEAEEKTERLFTQPEGGSDSTRANAFKHAYWHAVMVNTIAQNNLLDDDKFYKAREFGTAHEAASLKSPKLASRRASAMDLHNNKIGYDWAVRHSPGGDGNHDDEWFCWTIRSGALEAKQGTFRPRGTVLRGVPASRLAYLKRFHQGTGERIRAFRNAEFSNGKACVEPD